MILARPVDRESTQVRAVATAWKTTHIRLLGGVRRRRVALAASQWHTCGMPMTLDEVAAAVTAELQEITDPKERYEAARKAEPLMKAALAGVARAAAAEAWDTSEVPLRNRRANIAATLGISRQRLEQLLDAHRLSVAREKRLSAQERKLRAHADRVAAKLQSAVEQEPA